LGALKRVVVGTTARFGQGDARGDRFLDPLLGFAELVGALEHFRRARRWDDHHPILIGDDDIGRLDRTSPTPTGTPTACICTRSLPLRMKRPRA